ncbi:MAG: DUF6273 domain-containing protein [Anaerolineae bacterium]|nr:DUF6273 domain-containing protein [Anaerolineae bacterium]
MNFLNAKAGDPIPFGAYPHTADGTDKTPIQWRVLQNTGSELFLLSEYIIDCKRYHNEAVDTTWRDCDIRRWLNTELFSMAFSVTEQEGIKMTTCTDNGEGSPDTKDRVFLLSIAEVKAFTSVQDGSMRRRTIATEYARVKKADGCYLYVYDKGVEQDYILEKGEKRGCSWWWTRTQLQIKDGSSSRAAFIGARSNIKSYGRVDIKWYGVRPAIKLDLTLFAGG